MVIRSQKLVAFSNKGRFEVVAGKEYVYRFEQKQKHKKSGRTIRYSTSLSWSCFLGSFERSKFFGIETMKFEPSQFELTLQDLS